MYSIATCNGWEQFLEFAQSRCSAIAFGNWLAPIRVLEYSDEKVVLEVPNIFVKEYLLSNYKKDLSAFLPLNADGDAAIEFQVIAPQKPAAPLPVTVITSKKSDESSVDLKLNLNYCFDTFIEGPTNQFVKSAAIGVAHRPAQSYNPLFIHGGVGLGKTHILHSIGHHITKNLKKLKVQCITTEAFINDLVESLRNKSVDRMKRYYRSDIDVLLFDDIQFLQYRRNFEDEFTNTFETLINQGKQIVITSDKPPSQLQLSERMIARMEWGLVAHIGIPELETRVAILQYKAQQRGLRLTNSVAFFIAEHIYNNVRQLEGAINRLSAHSRLLNTEITEELVENILKEALQHAPRTKISVEQILKTVATVFEVRLSELKSTSRLQRIAEARQVAMYLACKFIKESLTMIAAYFGRTHSTLLHACKNIEKSLPTDQLLSRKVSMVEKSITA